MPKTAIPAEAFDHGDPRRYRRGCRCRPCTQAITARNRRQQYLRDTGRRALVAPDKAATHIWRLRAAGLNDLAITSAANICYDTLRLILRGQRDILRTTERKVLAVPVPTERAGRSGAHIPGLGTIRRLRAHAADGWPASLLAQQLGKHKQFIVWMQNNDPATTTVRLWVADYVRDLCARLDGQTPEDHGVRAHIVAGVRKTAAGKGWVGTAYWDAEDYDNPDFEPAVVELPRYVVLAENWAELEAQGYTRALAAERLGVSRDCLTQSITRYRASLAAAA